jgi:hypothetical protein
MALAVKEADAIVQRAIHQPIRSSLVWKDTWESSDGGLIKCWEIGRQRALADPDLAQRCRDGQLPVLGWKGGHSRVLKKNVKFGSLNYLAQWQGLRTEDLHIDRRVEITLTCSITGMHTTFTASQEKYANSVDQTE